MNVLVLNYLTFFLLRKRYNNTCLNFNYYFFATLLLKKYLFLYNLYNLNKQIYDFCDDHFTYSFKNKLILIILVTIIKN